MCEEIIQGIISNAIFFLLVFTIGWILYLLFRRRKLINFFKITGKKLTIYLSNIRVISGGSIGIDGNQRAYQDSTVSFGESFQANQYYSIFHYLIPGLRQQPGILKYLLVSDIELYTLLSPTDINDITTKSTIISLGSPGYNIVSDWIQKNHNSKASFINDNKQIQIDRLPPISDTKQCFVERIFDEINNRFIFYAAGLSELGTIGAAYYLSSHWKKLYKEYPGNLSFCILLEINPNNYQESRVISKTD